MKIILIAITTVILITTSQIAFTKDVDEVLNNYIEAIGGKNVIESINSELSIGNFDAMGTSGEIRIYFDKPGKVLSVVVFTGGSDDESILMKDYISQEKGFTYQLGQVIEYDEEAIARRIRKSFDENYQQLCLNYKNLGYSAEMETEQTEFGDIHKVTFSKDGNKVSKLSFDANSFLLINSEDFELSSSVSYSDYKEVGDSGFLKPYRLQQIMSGFTVDIIITDYRFNVSEPENISVVPEL